MGTTGVVPTSGNPCVITQASRESSWVTTALQSSADGHSPGLISPGYLPNVCQLAGYVWSNERIKKAQGDGQSIDFLWQGNQDDKCWSNTLYTKPKRTNFIIGLITDSNKNFSRLCILFQFILWLFTLKGRFFFLSFITLWCLNCHFHF